MITYETRTLMPVDKVVRKIVKKAKKKRQAVQTIFNGVKLIARPGSSEQEILAYYWQLKS